VAGKPQIAIEKQITRVTELLAEEKPRTRIEEIMAEEFGCTKRETDARIKRANEEAEAEMQHGRSKRRARSRRRYLNIYRKCSKAENWTAAIAAAKRIDELEGNDEPTKSEIEVGEATRAAILGQYTVEISDEALDEACDVSE